MSYRRWSVLLAVVAAVSLSAVASAQVQSKCLAGKNNCIAKKASSLLKCEQKAETPGKDPNPNAGDCVVKAKAKFDGGTKPSKGCFEKLEAKPENDCVTFDDTAAAEGLTDSCVGAIVAAIDPPPLNQSKCGADKKKCASKKLKGLLKCYQKAETPGKPTDPNTKDCITKAIAKFDGGVDPAKGCFAKLEANPKNDCLKPVGNSAGVEAVVDQCVNDVVALLTTPTTPTTTTTAPTTSTTTSRAARPPPAC